MTEKNLLLLVAEKDFRNVRRFSDRDFSPEAVAAWEQTQVHRVLLAGGPSQYGVRTAPRFKCPAWKFAALLVRFPRCPGCTKGWSESNTPTVDHVTPRSLGGSDDLENLQLLCKSCNSSKGSRMPA